MNPSLVLLDTNVWLDIYLPGRVFHEPSQALVNKLISRDIAMGFTTSQITDIFFNAALSIKRCIREESGALTEPQALVANETAWGFIQNIYEIGMLLPGSQTVLNQALKLKSLHTDFEDDLLLATAQIANADFLVTNDAALLSKGIVPSMSSQNMLVYLKAMQ